MTKKRLNFFIFVLLVGATFGFGYCGWTKALAQVSDLPPLEVLYRTLLAFTGDSIYVADPEDGQAGLNWMLGVARITGLGATISALFGLALVFLGGVAKRFRAALARGRHVIIGASDFAVDYAARQGKITIFDTEENLEKLDPQSRDAGGLWLPDRMDDDTATGRAIGRAPRQVIFGSPDAITNVHRARLWLSEVPEKRRRNTELTLRVEDNSVARDLSLLSGEFGNAKLISRGEMVARSLVTGMAPTQLAHLRGQKQVHIVLIGLGKVNLAVAEELVLRCHRPGLLPLRLTILDNRLGCAQARLRAERPDLLNPEFRKFGPHIEFFEMDALECCADGQADLLIAAESQTPVTALVVAAGEDERNVAIAIRLRQLQLERLCLKAPIYMRSDSLTSIAPEPVEDLTGGIVAFGGRVLDAEDLALEDIYEAQAKAIHDRWRETLGDKKAPENAWENLSTRERRSSYRAALASVEMFYAAGLVPPFGMSVAGLRAHETPVDQILGDDELLQPLWRAEHERWNAERRAEGYRGRVDGPRDNEKKLHPLIVPCDDLPESERNKDRNNVRMALENGRQRFRDARRSPCWRAVLRVGVMGPLAVEEAMLDRLEEQFRAAFEADVLPGMGERELEILSPNAPGFDRMATQRLLTLWHGLTGRQARVLLFNSARVPLVDRIAAEHLAGGPLDQRDRAKMAAVLDRLGQESTALQAAAAGQIRRLDLRPLAVSDADLDSDRDAYFGTVRRVQDQIMGLADMMIFETNGGKSRWTSAACDAWKHPRSVKLRLS
ncbi:hypothetical protein AAFO92_13305 [Roseovarius sp. CAU 1744]|uniref:hypothetical protein n=1 Tax=Roseovarius sp. CAU 1744 TaxID=3140368 RepID=UPI00325BFC8C